MIKPEGLYQNKDQKKKKKTRQTPASFPTVTIKWAIQSIALQHFNKGRT